MMAAANVSPELVAKSRELLAAAHRVVADMSVALELGEYAELAQDSATLAGMANAMARVAEAGLI